MINQSDNGRCDKAIDDAIAKVGKSLPAIRKLAATKKQKRATDRLQSDQARSAFQAMSADSLLNADGDDICVCKHDQLDAGQCGCKRVPGN